jgi:hypothetical protein
VHKPEAVVVVVVMELVGMGLMLTAQQQCSHSIEVLLGLVSTAQHQWECHQSEELLLQRWWR